MRRAAVGIDVGGTKIAGAVVGPDATLFGSETIATPSPEAGSSATEVLGLIDRLTGSAGAGGLSVEQIGVGVPEYVTPDGRITSALVLPSIRELPAVSTCGLPILIDSDVRCAARAEARFGHGRDLASFLFVVVGTGVSSTLVVGGRLWAGHRGEAIALGEMDVDPALALRAEAPLTVEEQASGRAIAAAAEPRRGGGGAHEMVPRRGVAGASGDPPAQDGIRSEAEAKAGRIVAGALCGAVALLDPAAVVVGGGLGASDSEFFGALCEHYRELTRSRPRPPPLLQTRLGSGAGVVGAGLLALEGRTDQRP